MAEHLAIIKQLRADNLFSRLAVNLGLATDKEVEECLGSIFSRREGSASGLAELMTEKGYLTAEEVQKIKNYQSDRVISCPKCNLRYNTILFKPEAQFFCYDCGTELQVPVSELDSRA